MITLYTPEEFEAAKSRQLLPLQCKHCGETFHRTKHEVQISQIQSKPYDFCGQSCLGQSRTLSLEVVCDQCGKSFTKRLSQIQKTKHHFCSQSCAAKYHNARKQTGTRRSKLEVWLEAQLPTLYPTLEIRFNDRDAIGSELDIYIPSFKLAFELNGLFHFEPIFGQGKLDTIQSNDNRKILACAEKGISLCLIDVSQIKYFKDRTSKPILEIIQKIIDQAISLVPLP